MGEHPKGGILPSPVSSASPRAKRVVSGPSTEGGTQAEDLVSGVLHCVARDTMG